MGKEYDKGYDDGMDRERDLMAVVAKEAIAEAVAQTRREASATVEIREKALNAALAIADRVVLATDTNSRSDQILELAEQVVKFYEGEGDGTTDG